MEKLSKTLSLETDLGEITIDAVVQGTGLSTANLTLTKLDVQSGENVKNQQAVLCRVIGTKHRSKIVFTASLNTKLIGGSCIGQNLEAMEWENSHSLVVVGTEDAESLNARMPFLHLEEYENIATYRASSLQIKLNELEPSHDIGLHFIVAENPIPEPVECSAWSAVNCSHQYLDRISRS